MAVYERRQGVQVAVMGDLWAAFSAVSGETMLLNDESAALLELLEQQGPMDDWAVSVALAADSGQSVEAVRSALQDSWAKLSDAAMVRQLGFGSTDEPIVPAATTPPTDTGR